MTDRTGGTADQSGFGMHGAFPDAMSAFNAKMQALGDATRAMLVDASEAPARLGQAGVVLTGDGEAGSIGLVLGAAAGWLVAALLVAALVRRLFRPVRLRLHAAGGATPGRV